VLKLVTGLPGDGKTSNELWDFLHAPAYKNRPKYCTPVNGFDAQANGVTEIPHLDKWQELPDGSVLFVDEVQKYCGTNIGNSIPPWVEAFAEHRHRGFDFIFTTQSPMFLHPFARKLAKPHVNYIRPWNMKMVRYTWDGVQNDPTTKTAKALGQSTFVKPNPEVFKLYTSTILDTHKAKPPVKLLAVLGVALFVVIGGSIFAYNRLKHLTAPEPVVVDQRSTEAVQSASVIPDTFAVGEGKEPVWTEDSMKPRIPGLLFTAPVYDELTAPSDFPRVAACMSSKTRSTCNCYTQQGTPLDVPVSACEVFITYSSFDPWLTARKQEAQRVDTKEEPVADRSKRGAQYTVVADNSRMERKQAVSK
jgi:zona occludens toxin